MKTLKQKTIDAIGKVHWVRCQFPDLIEQLADVVLEVELQDRKEWLTQKLDGNHLDDVSYLFYQEHQPEKGIFEKGFKIAINELLEDLIVSWKEGNND